MSLHHEEHHWTFVEVKSYLEAYNTPFHRSKDFSQKKFSQHSIQHSSQKEMRPGRIQIPKGHRLHTSLPNIALTSSQQNLNAAKTNYQASISNTPSSLLRTQH